MTSRHGPAGRVLSLSRQGGQRDVSIHTQLLEQRIPPKNNGRGGGGSRSKEEKHLFHLESSFAEALVCPS